MPTHGARSQLGREADGEGEPEADGVTLVAPAGSVAKMKAAVTAATLPAATMSTRRDIRSPFVTAAGGAAAEFTTTNIYQSGHRNIDSRHVRET
jgi:hypothetical protein